MTNQFLSVAREHVDDGDLHHRVAAWLQAHRSAGHVYQHLTRQSGVVDAHIELHTLVGGLARDTLANKVHTMAHVAHSINAVYSKHMGLVVGEIWVSLDVLGHLFQSRTFFEFHIHHAAVDAFAQRNRHREGVFHAFLGANTNTVPHRHARAEIGV